MNDGTLYEQGDIVLLPFPYSDLTGAKQRPALIISNETLNPSQDRICCLITSKKPTDGILIRQESLKTGTLPFQSWVKPHRIFTIHEGIIRKKLCTCTKKFHETIIQELLTYIQ